MPGAGTRTGATGVRRGTGHIQPVTHGETNRGRHAAGRIITTTVKEMTVIGQAIMRITKGVTIAAGSVTLPGTVTDDREK